MLPIIPLTDLYIGSDPELERIGVMCTVPHMAVYTYAKGAADSKITKISWSNIYRLEVFQGQVEITFKRVSSNISFYKPSKIITITFPCTRVHLLISELINLKLVKVCDRAAQLITNRIFYKPKGASEINYKFMRSLITEQLFKELYPKQIPLIEL